MRRAVSCLRTPAGGRIYVLKYRANGGQRWLTIGRHGEITAEQARKKAVKLRGAIADGKDPARIRDDQRAQPTVNELADRYLTEHAEPHKKPRSIEEDRRNPVRHVRPDLGELRVGEVTRQGHSAAAPPPVDARRGESGAGALIENVRAGRGMGRSARATNPCRRVPKYKENARDRFLSTDELNRLGEALDEAERDGEHPSAIAIVKLLLLTGCRRNEVLTLEWSHVDFEHGCLRLADSKTGAKVVHLGPPALDLLASLPRFSGPFVFPPHGRAAAAPATSSGSPIFGIASAPAPASRTCGCMTCATPSHPGQSQAERRCS